MLTTNLMTSRTAVSWYLAGVCWIMCLVAAPVAVGDTIYDFVTSNGGWAAEGSPAWTWASGTGWSTNGNDGPAENYLVSPAFTVTGSGQVYGSLVHVLSFEDGFDGGVIDYRVNAGSWNSINTSLVGLSGSQGYNGTLKYMPPGYNPGFTGSLGPVTSTFALGAGLTADVFSPGDVVQVRFHGWWDSSEIAADPNWRITSASLSVAPVPEIDPAGLGSILALVTGALGLLERRRALSA